jgi:hypothetical protein
MNFFLDNHHSFVTLLPDTPPVFCLLYGALSHFLALLEKSSETNPWIYSMRSHGSRSTQSGGSAWSRKRTMKQQFTFTYP